MNKYILFSNIIIFLCQIVSISLSDCNYTHPIKKNGACIEGGCSASLFESETCTIGNDIINDQWLNSINIYTNTGMNYATLTTTPNGDLICISSVYSSSKTLYFFGLKKNGRSYFTEGDEETSFKTTVTDQGRYEGNIFAIKLDSTSNNGDKEYVIGFANNNASFELYDFDNDKVYRQNTKTFFGTKNNFFQRACLFKLNSTENNYYIINIVAHNSKWENSFLLKKFLFYNVDINNYPPSQETVSETITRTTTSSCFESESNYIFCFYLDTSEIYQIKIYNHNLEEIGSSSITSTFYTQYTNFKCIHFTGDAGAFFYYNSVGNFSIHFKEYRDSIVKDYFDSIPVLEIKSNNYINITKNSDFIKLSDKKICLALLSSNYYELNLFVINNYIDEKIKIRHYNIKVHNLYLFRIKDEMSLSLYNGMVALVGTIVYDGSSQIGALIVFSYPNSTDFTIDITDNLISFTNPILKLYEKGKIENNIFGYILSGYKIYNYTTGLKLLKQNDNEEIKEDTFLSNNIDIELSLTNEINIEENGRIQFGMVATEPEYEIYNEYPLEIIYNYCGGSNCEDEKNYFSKQTYLGRISYCDITFNLNQITNNCNENCIVCIKDTDRICIVCKYSYTELPEGGKNCLGENEIISIIPTTIPTTIPITISTTIPSTIPNIIPTAITKTILTTFFNTHTEIEEKNIITIIPSVIATTTQRSENTNFDGKNCTNEEILKNNCTKGKITINQIDYIKNNILYSNYTKENTVIKTENVIIQISTLEDQQNSDDPVVSNIDLGECENILKDSNDLSRDDTLIIFKTDIKTEDLSSTYVAYEVYHPYTLKKLNLSICEDVQITVRVPVILDDSVESLINSVSNSGYDIFNENSSFYNDICATYTSENGTDMLLSDRKKDIYEISQNQTMCQTGCQLESYNSTSKKAKCNCAISSENVTSLDINDLFDEKEIAKSFYNTLTNSNFRVLKCYKLIIDFSKILRNTGEILMSTLFIIFLILIFVYIINGQKLIHNYIDLIIKMKNINNKKFERNNKNKTKQKIKENKKINIFKKSLKNNKSKSRIKNKKNNKKEPPRKKKPTSALLKKNINNQKKQTFKRNSVKKFSKGYINNNILLNVQVIKDEKNKKRNNRIKEKNKRKLSNKKSIYSDIHTKKSLNTFKLDNLENLTEKNIKINKFQANEENFKSLNDQQINNLQYDLAIKYDKRTYFQYYWSLLKKKQLILFTFLPNNDYNLTSVKIALFIVSFSLYFTINGFFFNDDTMHKVYEDNGSYNFLNQLPQILYSSVISAIINMILKQLSLSEKNILEIKEENNINEAIKKSKQKESCLKTKFIIFFLIILNLK